MTRNGNCPHLDILEVSLSELYSVKQVCESNIEIHTHTYSTIGRHREPRHVRGFSAGEDDDAGASAAGLRFVFFF